MDTHTHTHTHLDTHSHTFGHTHTHIWTHTHVPSGRCPGTLGSCWSCGRSDRCSCVCGFIYCDVHTNMIKNVSIQWVNTHTHMYKYIITHSHTHTNTHTHTSYPWLSGTLMGVHWIASSMYSSCSDLMMNTLKYCCSLSFAKLMQNCSNELCWKFSKPVRVWVCVCVCAHVWVCVCVFVPIYTSKIIHSTDIPTHTQSHPYAHTHPTKHVQNANPL
jgi:hypothetical protein